MPQFRCAVFVPCLVLLSMTGCPPQFDFPLVLPGEWNFQLSDAPGVQVRIFLLEDGSTVNPPVTAETDAFAGTLTWMQDLETGVFTMNQDFLDGFVYTGAVYARTYMEGTVRRADMDTPFGTWTASYVP